MIFRKLLRKKATINPRKAIGSRKPGVVHAGSNHEYLLPARTNFLAERLDGVQSRNRIFRRAQDGADSIQIRSQLGLQRQKSGRIAEDL